MAPSMVDEGPSASTPSTAPCSSTCSTHPAADQRNGSANGGRNRSRSSFRPPDGREILFRAPRVDDISSGVTIKPKIPGLFVMNADGTNVRTLINPPHDQPAEHP